MLICWRKKMKRTIYAYSMNRVRYKHRMDETIPSLKNDLVKIIRGLSIGEMKAKFYNIASENKGVYLRNCSFYDKDGENIEEENMCETAQIVLTIVSVKYHTQRRVRDAFTLEERGILKGKNDGDEETTSFIMKFCKDDTITCLAEYNRSGASIKDIITYLNVYINKYYSENFHKKYYKLEYQALLSKNFIQSLKKTRKIKMCTLTVAQEDLFVSDGKRFANRDDISSDVDIVMKPASAGVGILRDSVESFYKMYYNKNREIKKITIKADCEGVNDLSFDTEKLKEKMTVDVMTTITGEVNTKDMIRILLGKIREY